MLVLGILPLAALGLLILIFANRTGRPLESVLYSFLSWGLAVFMITESLSIFRVLIFSWVVLVWTGLVLALLVFFLKSNGKVLRGFSLQSALVDLTTHRGRMILCVWLIAGVTLLVALLAPPNAWDAMDYHMGRVLNWAQNASVHHYPTNIDRQLFLPPWSDFAVLQFQLLSGSDRFANLVQWLSMLSCLAGVASIATLLGASEEDRVTAAIFAATIPMAILQASEANNHLSATLWLLCFAFFVLRGLKSSDLRDAAGAGLSLGLAIMTQGIAYFFALPFALWYALGQARQSRPRAIRNIALIAGIVVLLNAGHLTRNYFWFGSPLYSGKQTHRMAFKDLVPGTVLSNVIRGATLHTTFSVPTNDLLMAGIVWMHEIMGTEVSDPATTSFPSQFPYKIDKLNTFENISGNPIHFVLICAALLSVLVSRRLRENRNLLFYALCLVAGFVLFSGLFKWSPFRGRLHLPLLIMMAPVVTIAGGELLKQRAVKIVCWLLVICSIPWLVSYNARPLYPLDRFTTWESVIDADRLPQYFRNRPDLEADLRSLNHHLNEFPCHTIGLVTKWNESEYPFRMFMEMRGQKLRVFHLGVSGHPQSEADCKSICATVFMGKARARLVEDPPPEFLYRGPYITVIKGCPDRFLPEPPDCDGPLMD